MCDLKTILNIFFFLFPTLRLNPVKHRYLIYKHKDTHSNHIVQTIHIILEMCEMKLKGEYRLNEYCAVQMCLQRAQGVTEWFGKS